jgi:hypothetical protein
MDVGSNKGALLYQDYKRRWVRILGWWALAVGFVFMAVFFVYLALYVGGPDNGTFEVVFHLFIAGSCVFLAAMLVILSIKTMPFKVYQMGVTMSMVPLRDGLAGRETFVPASDIVDVRFKTIYRPKTGPEDIFVFHLADGEIFSVSTNHHRTVTSLLRRVLQCPVGEPE